MKTHNLFISHSWRYAGHYDRLVKMLRERRYFQFKDYSVSLNDPIQGARTDAQLRRALKQQIAPSSVVLIPAGVYATHSKWINIEIGLAKNDFTEPKPIIAIRPWGSQRTSVPVREAADIEVGWNTESIVSAIREVA